MSDEETKKDIGEEESKGKRIFTKLLKLVDIRQPEVKFALSVATILEVFFIAIRFHSGFNLYIDEVISLLHCVIGGLFGLVGFAIAGVSIVIALFTPEQ